MSEHQDVLSIIERKNSAPLTLEPARTALLVIDVQGYFVQPEGAFGQLFEHLVPGITAGYFRRVREQVLPNVSHLQATFRARGMAVLYTATGTRTGDGRDLPGWLRELDELGLAVMGKRVWPGLDEPAFAVDEAVAPRAGEPVFTKTSSGPVASTRMDQTLRHLGIDTVVVAGLTTDVCTTQTARELADRGFAVIVAEDATTTLSEEMHKSALQCFNIAFGKVRPTGTILELLEASATAELLPA